MDMAWWCLVGRHWQAVVGGWGGDVGVVGRGRGGTGELGVVGFVGWNYLEWV